MCSIFEFKIPIKYTKDYFDISLDSEISGRAHPYSFVPVITIDSNQNFLIKNMNFSLVPHWSKERKVRFATHNARLFGEDGSPIFTKPTWKIPFAKNHCLVVMDSFVESVHQGPHAGNLISFKKSNKEPMIAAGIFDQWIDKATGEVLDSFSILTHEPPKFVLDSGHDRCPVFLNNNAALKWPSFLPTNLNEQLDFLTSNIIQYDFSVTIDKPLKNYNAQTEFKF